MNGVGFQNICRLLGHQRSKRAARPLATTWTSKCWICGQRIVRLKRQQWIPLDEMRQHAAALYGPTFAQTWPVDHSFCFDELLRQIDARLSAVREPRQFEKSDARPGQSARR